MVLPAKLIQLVEAGERNREIAPGGARPLTVISNRAPYQLKRQAGRVSRQRNVGGLVSVLDGMMRDGGGTWIAWGDGEDSQVAVDVPPEEPKYSLRLVTLTAQEVQDYYYGFANRVLWPLAHYSLDRCHFHGGYWSGYRTVNEKFAAAFGDLATGRGMVWIHDFHLTLLPALLRARSDDLAIGFFWHIPFPASPVFRVLPWREEVLRGLLGCDLIGFHLGLHAQNFLQCVEDLLHLPVDRNQGSVRYEGRLVRTGVFPVGIDYRFWNDLAARPFTRERARQIRKEIGAEQIILGVDRLDYTKGIVERLAAYERFLEKTPDYRGRVSLIQIAVPSRTGVDEYRALRRQIDEAVGRITGRFSRDDWVPVHYLCRALEPEGLAAYYAAADLALVTPLRDGMNLVAKEYIATRTAEDGVLILSEFTGAAETLTDAVIVNPVDIEKMADRIRTSLMLSPAEKRVRMQRLRQKVRGRDIYWWCGSFINALGEIAETSVD